MAQIMCSGAGPSETERLMPWWTCNYCHTVFFGEAEPHNGHTLTCDQCWDRKCKNPDECWGCQHETRKLLRSLDAVVNPPDNPRWH